MEQHKPLSYQCLKSVIQFMVSNFRLVRSCQIVSLRNIQKVVPLRLGVLELDNSRFSVDNIDCRYKHCRKCTRNGGPVTTLHLEYDINNDGDKEIFHDLMPGDILIKERDWQSFPFRDVNFINDSYVTCDFQTGLNHQCQYRQSHYGMKIRDMMRKTLYRVLGGKRIHQVEHLKIGIYHGVLRLPEGVKLKIRKLSIANYSMTVIDAILPILDVSSFPLKSLSITLEDTQDPVIHSDVLRSSEFLNIESRGFFDDNWANLLIDLPNMKIHLKNQIDLNEIILLVRNFMKHPRVIGRRFSMQPVSVKKCLNEIEKEFKVVKGVLPEKECIMAFPCFTLPMTSISELNFYGAMSTSYKEQFEIYKIGQPYMIVMEVMPIGTAKPLKD